MADISKIKLPGNDMTYDIKDANAISDISASGSTITFTKRNGTTNTVTVQSGGLVATLNDDGNLVIDY